jgi:uncharacterized cupin superfamily protein
MDRTHRQDNAMSSKPAALAAGQVPAVTGSGYPEQFKSRVAARRKQRLGDAFGLKSFGVNLTTIPPGAASALRHWHSHEDEFIYVVSGELTLVTDAGEQRLTPGMCAGFPAGRADGHCLVNRSGEDAVYLEVGDRRPDDAVTYPDDDIVGQATPRGRKFTRKDGTPY